MKKAASLLRSFSRAVRGGWRSSTRSTPSVGRQTTNGEQLCEIPLSKLRELEQSQAFLDSIIENIPNMIFVKEAQSLRFVRFNRAGEELLGMQRDSLIGRSDFDFFPADQATHFVQKDREVLRNGKLMEIRSETIDTKRHGRRYLHTKKLPIFNAEGEPQFLLGISEDVTERLKAEEALHEAHQELEQRVLERTRELAEANARLRQEVQERTLMEEDLLHAKKALEEANQSKDYFFAALSHELRTPLTPVLIAAKLIQKDPRVLPDIRTHAEVISKNVQLEVRLIDDLLDLTRITRGKLKLSLEEIDVAVVAHDTVQLCTEEIGAKQLVLGCDIPVGTFFVRGDKTRLHQVLWNLLKNAVKFTPPRGTITLGTRAGENDSVVLSVSDTGIGMEQALVSKLFHAFEQGSPQITRQFGGLGLGLAISRAVVEQHGGSIRAESPGPGLGSTFYVSLPRITPDASHTQSAPATIAQDKPHRTFKVLLVEDHPASAQLLSMALREEDHEIHVAHTMQEALAQAEQEHFDLVISDVGLPDGSGHDLMRTLRARTPMKGIAVSGYGREEDIQQSRDAGFAYHFTKPVDIDRLLATMEEICRP